MSEERSFGTLEDVDLRLGWPHEASDFAPWLASNPDRLSGSLGVSLVLEGREIPVGPYEADLIARTLSGERVLIENQLAEGDHGHLGQILTYLTGPKAEVIVWVAKNFREEHLSAVAWLNDNTVEPFAFFAVRLRLVQIGGSPTAPVFEVVARPSSWDRQLQARAAEETSPQTERQRRFWSEFEASYPETSGELHGGRGTTRWRPIGELNLVVARWFAPGGVGVFVRGERATSHSDWLEILDPFSEELVARLGVRRGREGESFSTSFQIDTTDEFNWPRAAEWLHNETERYVQVLRDVLGAQT